MEHRYIIGTGMLAACLAWAPARAADTEQARSLADHGQILEAQGEHEAALADLTQAIGLRALPTAEQARLLFARGVIEDQRGQLAGALEDYSAAIQLSPDFGPALNNRANVYRRQNRPIDAGRDYLASLAAGNPQPEYSWFGLGQIAEAGGDEATARLDYSRAIAANPAYQPAADRLAVLGGGDGLTQLNEIIHLKPPLQTTGAKEGLINLKPPSQPTIPHAHVGSVAVPRISPARYTPDSGPDLRPAIDSSPVSGVQIQLGAWRTELEAGEGWNKAVKQSGGLLDGLLPHILATDLPGRGRYYRLRAGPVEGPPGQLCKALTARGLACMPSRE